MKLFLGQYRLVFSGKGRIVLPKKVREVLGKDVEIVLSRGLDGCVFGFSKKQWEKEANRQLTQPVTDEQSRNLRRYLFSAAQYVGLDEQGRFVIPESLLKFAKLRREVELIGAGDHFEIWHLKGWKEVIKKIDKR